MENEVQQTIIEYERLHPEDPSDPVGLVDLKDLAEMEALETH